MINKSIQPQSIELWYIIPLIRKSLALALKKQDIPQNKIASFLGITEAAISQYSNNKRATEIKFNNTIRKEINNASKRIIENNSNVTYEIQNILNMPDTLKATCYLHKKYADVPKNCDICKKK